MTILLRTREELAQARAELAGRSDWCRRWAHCTPATWPISRPARPDPDSTVVSIFVNPMQFNQAEDFDRYPRTLAEDLAICERAGVDLVWNPDVDTMYRGGKAGVWLTAGPLADQLEGPNRPGHFDGVLTVVCKLFTSVRPELAFFGEKDYQQLTLIRRMVLDLDLPVAVEGVPTVRDPDGLALSSRNVFLSEDDRAQAVKLNQALTAARQHAGTVEAGTGRGAASTSTASTSSTWRSAARN